MLGEEKLEEKVSPPFPFDFLSPQLPRYGFQESWIRMIGYKVERISHLCESNTIHFIGKREDKEEREKSGREGKKEMKK